MTPLDRLASLPDVHACLRQGITLEHLRELATALSEVQAAEELNAVSAALFQRVPARRG
jgi:major membrane immunogen (membrane-anchored lipoprotein)